MHLLPETILAMFSWWDIGVWCCLYTLLSIARSSFEKDTFWMLFSCFPILRKDALKLKLKLL